MVYIVIIPSVSKTDLLVHPVPQPYQINNFIVLKVFSDLASRLYMRSELWKNKMVVGVGVKAQCRRELYPNSSYKTLTHIQLNTFLS